MERAKKKKRKINLRLMIRCILIVLLVYSAYRILSWNWETSREKKEYEELKQEVIKEDNSINFSKLKEKNDDIVGWVKVAETQIDYPIVQAKDNAYYLTRDINKKANRSGSIFMDYQAKEDFTDPNTILYGHNMKNGTMFGELRKVYDGELKENTITIHTQDFVKKYRIFSVYISEPSYNMQEKIEKGYGSFLEEIIKKSNIDFHKTVTSKDKIITLATCSYRSSKRLIVHAVEEE